MQLTGQLAEFSLPEIFHFSEQFYKSGLLLLQPEPNAELEGGKTHYLWFKKGRIIAVADNLDRKGLLSMLKHRGWLKPEQINLLQEWSEIDQPLGVYLKAKQVLTDEQLQVLFHAQAIQPVCALFKLPASSRFTFDSKTTLPKAEMTGLNLPASEANLLGLRVLRDWTALAQKLPHSTFGLHKASAGKPRLQLDSQEWQVWEVADGKISIEAIALRLQLPVETVQEIAFRMRMAGLVDAVPLVSAETKQEPMVQTTPESAMVASDRDLTTNQSLMKNIVNLLNTKIV
ncbi:MAG TPA: hypothetical protein DEV81_04385 [Cyanobacteria bacterium UBA11049]|nr:hypothetical protein [Cyanobacteria bacterium UBA11049]